MKSQRLSPRGSLTKLARAILAGVKLERCPCRLEGRTAQGYPSKSVVEGA